ncbi:MAG TPA: hypothetical protein VMT55_00090 [Candidatus Sulfotelmatobacter sp.]|nr:hypothetical protein [Candidatus Sulfotelmatobacter sp.]
MTIAGSKSALRPGLQASFGAQGGTAPYVFSCSPYVAGVSGAGGTIDPATGLYTAPPTVRTDQRNFYDQVTVTDSTGAKATTSILVGWSWMMVLDVLRQDLGLDPEHCYFWDQKINMPEDSSLILVVGISRAKPLASNLVAAGDPVEGGGPGWDQVTSYTQVNSSLDIHVYSRGMDASFRLAEVFASLQSPYSRTQQSANGFYLSKIPRNAVDASLIDGAAIPYHYVVSCEMIWTHSKTLTPPYYTQFPQPVVELIQA